MTEDKSNKCGIKPLLFGGWAVEACKWHDGAYTKDSPHQREGLSRGLIDDYFLIQLKEKIKEHPFYLRPFMYAQAYIMYGIVRQFGSKWWEGKE